MEKLSLGVGDEEKLIFEGIKARIKKGNDLKRSSSMQGSDILVKTEPPDTRLYN